MPQQADLPPHPDWTDDDPPAPAEADFAYWAFAPDDQELPEWAYPDMLESEEDCRDRMNGDDPAGDFCGLRRWPEAPRLS